MLQILPLFLLDQKTNLMTVWIVVVILSIHVTFSNINMYSPWVDRRTNLPGFAKNHPPFLQQFLPFFFRDM